MVIIIPISILFVVLLSSCTSPKELLPNATAEQLAQGKQLFAQHCASCHGNKAQGHPQWRHPDANGNYPPPALDGSAHSWHHSLDLLRTLIAEGVRPAFADNPANPPSLRMPAWEEKLTAQQIDNIIIWFQSLWPAQVYQTWRDINQRAP